MKIICALVIQETTKNDVGYITDIMHSWKNSGVEAYAIYGDKVSPDIREIKPVCATMQDFLNVAHASAADMVIFMDDSFMGPLFSLDAMLTRIKQCMADVWYLARRAPMIGLKKSLLKKLAIVSAAYSGRIEKLTSLCRSMSLKMEELYCTDSLTALTEDPMLDEPLFMARDLECPFFLHEVFHRDYEDVYQRTLGHQGQVFYKWLQKNTAFDTKHMWDYLVGNVHQDVLYRNMHLTYVLPTKGCDEEAVREHIREQGLALVMHLYYEDKFMESREFVSRFPPETSVFITTSSKKKQQALMKVMSGLKFAQLEVRVIENRGRDVSSLLVGVADVINKYEYICFFHDKKTMQTKPGSIGAGFAYRCAENLFGTKEYILNIVQSFAENKRLGMVSPPPPHHGEYFFTLCTDWGPNYELTRQLKESLGFSGPIASDHMPLAPLGTCFWFRSKAMKPLFDVGWQYEDFPPEPNNADGTILHAIERIYPFACITAGYYPAYIMTDRYASVEYTNMRYYVRGYNEVCFHHGILNYQREMRAELDRRLRSK